MAFTLPGKGQFHWITSPMGLLGCPASFQRLMEGVLRDINNVLVYIDDLLATIPHRHSRETPQNPRQSFGPPAQESFKN